MIYIIIFSIIITLYELNKNKFFIKKFPNLTVEKKLIFLILLIIHHILSIILILGPFVLLSGYLSSRKYIYLYLLFNIIIMIHWKINKRCILSEWTNEILEINKNEGFRDIFNIITNNYPKYFKNKDYSIEYIVVINILLSLLSLYKNK